MADKIFTTPDVDPLMEQACQRARDNFKYFWRELSWEYRRIVPAFDMCAVKIRFEQQIKNKIEVEHMWVGDVNFDGQFITGTLMNQPNVVTNVKNGDNIKTRLTQLSDWLILSEGQSIGGFTIQLMRSRMSEQERKEHDDAWGVNFGDYDKINVVNQQDEHPEYLLNHPMSAHIDSFKDFLSKNPDQTKLVDDNGLTMLHRECLAGNKNIVDALLEYEGVKDVKTKSGKTPLELARYVGWDKIVEVLK